MDAELTAWLSSLVGSQVTRVDSLRENRPLRRVSRVVLSEGPSVIVKHLADEPGVGRADDREYALACLGNEALALSVLGQHAPGLAPGLVGVNASHGAVVLTDLGARPSLATLLLGDEATAAAEGLRCWAEALGNLHGACAGRTAEIETVRRSIGLPTRGTGFLGDIERRWHAVTRSLADWGLSAPRSCGDEVEAVEAALRDPRFATLLHGDPCPDNTTVDPLVLFDWETAYVGHALLDAAYLWMPFPTCWCAGEAPGKVVAEAEVAYRRAASAGLPEVADDGSYRHAMGEAVVAWWIQTSVWGLERSTADDPTWGISTHRHRLVHRARVLLARRDELAARYPGLIELAASIEAAASERWPEAARGLATFPAFA